MRRLVALVATALSALLLAAHPAHTALADRDPLRTAFAKAAAAHDVPRDLLAAIAYAETHLDGHDGSPSASGGYGVMHLVSNPTTHTLEKAAELTGPAGGEAARRHGRQHPRRRRRPSLHRRRTRPRRGGQEGRGPLVRRRRQVRQRLHPRALPPVRRRRL
ncbi:hypothetical protein [Nonomuraea dietziae]|uniref:hypothetical protein n=1 Tax=Nonomuraea dietziae TaxID=65515 RepID=UPI0031E01213